LVSSKVIRLRCWFRVTLTVNRFELRNRNRFAIPIIICALVVLEKIDINPPEIWRINSKILAYIDTYGEDTA
jgi:hypothetical protein